MDLNDGRRRGKTARARRRGERVNCPFIRDPIITPPSSHRPLSYGPASKHTVVVPGTESGIPDESSALSRAPGTSSPRTRNTRGRPAARSERTCRIGNQISKLIDEHDTTLRDRIRITERVNEQPSGKKKNNVRVLLLFNFLYIHISTRRLICSSSLYSIFHDHFASPFV